MKKIRTRFAPSPTGSMHIGNLRTALFAYLIARHENGDFILRLEDTDRERLVEGAHEEILTVLDWVGLDLNESPTMGGDYGPYVQSERLDIYKKYAQELVDKGFAYYCFCSQEDLKNEREQGGLSMYSGKCRDLDQEIIDNHLKNGDSYVIRLKVPKSQVLEYSDPLYGNIKFDTNVIDDQVLIKSDGFPTYHLAVVIDDHLMEITHIVRGNEYVSSVGKYILMYRAFGWDMPINVHVPPILGDDGKKLSKRKGDVAAKDFRVSGYLPEALLNFIVLLGWNPGGDIEIMSKDEIIAKFSFDRIQKKGAIFDRDKLNWMNKQYLMKMDESEILKRFGDVELVDRVKNLDSEYLKKIIKVEKSRMNVLTDINNIGDYYFVDPNIEIDKLVFKKSTKQLCMMALQKVVDKLEKTDDWESIEKMFEILKEVVSEDEELNNGDVFWPVRYALSGVEQSSSPNELLWVLGKENSLVRIKRAIELLGI